MDKYRDHPPYPEPFVVEPSGEHNISVILLHGRGSNGEKFGTELLKSHTTLGPSTGSGSDPMTFADMFPDAKFVFPTAKKRRAKWYNRATINQWFDNVPVAEQDQGMSQEQEEWQIEGLRQSRAFLKSLVEVEVNLVGAANVIIGGLSQGCAMSLHMLLSYEDSTPLAGYVGMSGWLPYAAAIEALVRPGTTQEQRCTESDNIDEDFDPFARSDTDDSDVEDDSGLFTTCDNTEPDASGVSDRIQRKTKTVFKSTATDICNLVRDNMDLPPTGSSSPPSWLSTPVFLGHGKSDETVAMSKGLQAATCLREIGLQVTWKEYDEGH